MGKALATSKPKDAGGKFISNSPFPKVSPQQEILNLKKAHKNQKPDREVIFYNAILEKTSVSQYQGFGIVLRIGETGKPHFLTCGMAVVLGNEIMMAGNRTRHPRV